MIRENLMEVEPRSLGLILLLLSLLVTTAIALYMIKPQYQRFNETSNSFEMLNSQIDDQAQLQRAIDTERNQIKEMQLQKQGGWSVQLNRNQQFFLIYPCLLIALVQPRRYYRQAASHQPHQRAFFCLSLQNDRSGHRHLPRQ